jgi:tRNA threonylcarbamoyladenosine biosynthesis protein TsaE
MRLELADSEASAALGVALAAAPRPLWLWLQGDIGSGKTTIARALLQSLGVRGRIKSPTYALIESYVLPTGISAHHLDLYRIESREALASLGIRELLDRNHWLLIEWPELAGNCLPEPDLALKLSINADAGRTASIVARPELELTRWLSYPT